MHSLPSKVIGIMALLVLLVAVPSIPAAAQDDSLARENGRKLEGAWLLQVTSVNCETGAALRSFPGMMTFVRGGALFEYSVGSATATGQPPTERSTAQGTWRYVENGSYSATVWFFRFGTDNLYSGATRTTFEILLSDDGESFTSTETSDGFNTAGVLTGTRCNTRTGTRIE
jgi:hypothetical protein